jgi:hypothetical protein
MIILPLKSLPKGTGYEYHGENPCIPRAALVELNFRLRPRWENQKTKLRLATLPAGWNDNIYGGGIERSWTKR